MPANVRNFWVDVFNSCRDQPVGTGPQRKDGTLDLRYLVRDNGKPTLAFSVRSFADDDGSLTVQVLNANGAVVHEVEAKR